jgi:hypothetical protein
MSTPCAEARLRLHAAANLLTAAAEGRCQLHDASDGARQLIDKALDAEAGALDIESEAP